MKLGLVTYQIAKDWTLEQIIVMCEKTGLEGVELRTTHAHKVELNLEAQARQEVRRKFAESGLVLWGFGTTCEYHSPDPNILRANIEETKAWIKLADDTGAIGVKVRPNAFVEGVPEEQTLRQIAEALQECGEYAKEYGIKIMLEVHGHGTQEPRHIRSIMQMCQHPNVGVTWNCNAGEVVNGSIKANFELLAPWICSVHIHDLYEPYPYKELIALLQEQSFTGFCLIEMPESCEPERLLKYYVLLWKEWTQKQ